MKKNNITARQLSVEMKLMNLVPRKNRVIKELRQITSIAEWKSLQAMIAEFHGLLEAEAVTDDQIEQLLIKAAAELKLPKPADIDVDAIERGEDDAIQIKKESKKSLNESLTISLILAAPTILKLIANIVDWVYRLFTIKGEEKKKYDQEWDAYGIAKKTGKLPDGTPADEHKLHDMQDALYKSKAGKAILGLAHKLHDFYIGGIRRIIAGLLWMDQDANLSMKQAFEKAKKPAEIIFAIVMIGLAGWGAVHAITAIPSAAAAVQSAGGLAQLTTAVIDTTKGGDMTVTAIKAVLGHVHL